MRPKVPIKQELSEWEDASSTKHKRQSSSVGGVVAKRACTTAAPTGNPDKFNYGIVAHPNAVGIMAEISRRLEQDKLQPNIEEDISSIRAERALVVGLAHSLRLAEGFSGSR